MPKTYRLYVDKSQRGKNQDEWVIEGLSDTCPFENTTSPDTRLILVGMYHSCDTPESVMAAVLRAIYDHHQCNEGLKTGDVIESVEEDYIIYGGYDPARGLLKIPAMRFGVESYHVYKMD